MTTFWRNQQKIRNLWWVSPLDLFLFFPNRLIQLIDFFHLFNPKELQSFLLDSFSLKCSSYYWFDLILIDNTFKNQIHSLDLLLLIQKHNSKYDLNVFELMFMIQFICPRSNYSHWLLLVFCQVDSCFCTLQFIWIFFLFIKSNRF